MKNWTKVVLMIAVISVVFVLGCKDDTTDPEITESEILIEYLIDNNMDLTDILSDWLITASDVHDDLANYYVIDTRSEDDYNIGHIPGAVLASASDILDVATNSGGKTIVVHCYKGIGATRLVTALRLSGYPTAKSMKFGMSAWGLADADSAVVVYDKWTMATSSVALDYPADWLLTATDPVADTEYNYPELATGEEEGADILADRVTDLLTNGYGYVWPPDDNPDHVDILANREDYFINNYWALDDWNKYGHIEGSHRINVLDLENGGIDKLDPDMPIVTYCWTSQTSGMITAYLTVLGYDAKSLILGANGLIYENLEGHAWGLGENVNPLLTVTPGANAPGEYELEPTN